MKVLESKNDLCHVETYLFLREPPLVVHVVKELAAGHEVHHEVDPVLALKNKLHRDQEGVIHLEHYKSL